MFRVALGALIVAATLILMITRPAQFCCCASRRTEQSAMLWRVMAYNVRKLSPVSRRFTARIPGWRTLL
jgi:hypothetical protein